jgi:hypothetical protein
MSAPLDRCRPEVVAYALLLRLVREELKTAAGDALPAMHDTIDYDDWLVLTTRERHLVSRDWISNFGENIHLPKEAGRRFMQTSTLPIVKVRVGIYHLGIYILNPELWPKDFDRPPPWFGVEFDGFMVGFCRHDPKIYPVLSWCA